MTAAMILTPGKVTLEDLEKIYRGSLAVTLDRAAQPAVERAADAVMLDTSDMTIEAAFAVARDTVATRLGRG